MYIVGDAHWCMSPVGGGGGEEYLWHVCSGDAMNTVGDAHWHMPPVRDGGGEEDLWHVHSGGRSVTHVPSGGWGRRGGSLPCMQCKTPNDICPQWGMGEERRIFGMYAAGDAQWPMSPVGDGGAEEDLCHLCSGGHSLTYVPSRGMGRRGISLPCMQWRRLVTHVPSGGRGRRGGSVAYNQWGMLRYVPTATLDKLATVISWPLSPHLHRALTRVAYYTLQSCIIAKLIICNSFHWCTITYLFFWSL